MRRELEKPEARRQLACLSAGFDLCGRLVVERERYARLEEEFEVTRRDSDRYREYFSVLLEAVGSKLVLSIIPEIFKYNTSEISQLKAAYCFQKRNMTSFWIFLEEENWKAEDEIYEIYGELLSMFPEYDIRIQLLRLWGRKPEDLLPPGGRRIIGE